MSKCWFPADIALLFTSPSVTSSVETVPLRLRSIPMILLLVLTKKIRVADDASETLLLEFSEEILSKGVDYSAENSFECREQRLTPSASTTRPSPKPIGSIYSSHTNIIFYRIAFSVWNPSFLHWNNTQLLDNVNCHLGFNVYMASLSWSSGSNYKRCSLINHVMSMHLMKSSHATMSALRQKS